MKYSDKRSLAAFDYLYDLTFPALSSTSHLDFSSSSRYRSRSLFPRDNAPDEVAVKGSAGLGSLDEHIVIFLISFGDDEDKTVPAHMDLSGHFLKSSLSTLP